MAKKSKDNKNVPDYAAKNKNKTKKKADPKKSELNSKGKVKFTARVSKWFKDLKSEIKKINWTSAKDTLKNTLVVLLVILVIGIGVWVADALFVKVREVIYNINTSDAEAALIYFKAMITSLSLL